MPLNVSPDNLEFLSASVSSLPSFLIAATSRDVLIGSFSLASNCRGGSLVSSAIYCGGGESFSWTKQQPRHLFPILNKNEEVGEGT